MPRDCLHRIRKNERCGFQQGIPSYILAWWKGRQSASRQTQNSLHRHACKIEPGHRPTGRGLAQVVAVYPSLSERGQCERGICGGLLEVPERRQQRYHRSDALGGSRIQGREQRRRLQDPRGPRYRHLYRFHPELHAHLRHGFPFWARLEILADRGKDA
eukprot:1049286-Pleurochrysis_carterae.AAC.1